MSEDVRDVDAGREHTGEEDHEVHDAEATETTVIEPLSRDVYEDVYEDVPVDIHADPDPDETATTIVKTEAPDAALAGKKSTGTGKFTQNWRRDIWHRQISVKPIPVILTLLVAITGGVTIWLYLQYHQPDQETGPSVARAAVSAASDGTVALLSYSSDSLDKDFASARSHLSGDFLSYYEQFTKQIVAPAAKQKSLKTTAHVMRAAVQELHPNSAVVLLFVDQSTTTKDNPEASMSASSVVVDLALIDGKWLITKFTPV